MHTNHLPLHSKIRMIHQISSQIKELTQKIQDIQDRKKNCISYESYVHIHLIITLQWNHFLWDLRSLNLTNTKGMEIQKNTLRNFMWHV
jgi:hypothetical protein